jgi:hypothetical protein
VKGVDVHGLSCLVVTIPIAYCTLVVSPVEPLPTAYWVQGLDGLVHGFWFMVEMKDEGLQTAHCLLPTQSLNLSYEAMSIAKAK